MGSMKLVKSWLRFFILHHDFFTMDWIEEFMRGDQVDKL
jgi:hypothetical protein